MLILRLITSIKTCYKDKRIFTVIQITNHDLVNLNLENKETQMHPISILAHSVENK